MTKRNLIFHFFAQTSLLLGTQEQETLSFRIQVKKESGKGKPFRLYLIFSTDKKIGRVGGSRSNKKLGNEARLLCLNDTEFSLEYYIL
jgi:hypothetical protein